MSGCASTYFPKATTSIPYLAAIVRKIFPMSTVGMPSASDSPLAADDFPEPERPEMVISIWERKSGKVEK